MGWQDMRTALSERPAVPAPPPSFPSLPFPALRPAEAKLDKKSPAFHPRKRGFSFSVSFRKEAAL